MKRPRFSLLSLFVVVTVIAGGLAILVSWIRNAERQERTVRLLTQCVDDEWTRLTVLYDHDQPGSGRADPQATRKEHLYHSVAAIMVNESANDQMMEHIGELTSLQCLSFWGCHFSREARSRLTDLRKLRYLCLVETEFDDDDVRMLMELKSLNTLHLNETGMTEDGLRYLESMTQLKELVIVLDWEFFGGREQHKQRLSNALPECAVHLLGHDENPVWLGHVAKAWRW